jgi:lipoprotein NlpI
MSILPFALARTARAQTLDETENRMHCQDPKADIRIAGCTAVIQSGKETHEALAVAFYNRGNAFKAKGEYDRAIQDYGQAIRLNPNYAAAFNNRGTAYNLKKQYKRAIWNFDQAIVLDPKLELSFENRGNAYNFEGEHERAIKDFDHAVSLNPNSASAFSNRAFNYLMMRKFDSAIADYDVALKLSPENAYSLYGRGLAERAHGRTAKGNEDVAAAKQIDRKIVSKFESYGLSL